jgi:hypothetical protein
MSRHPRDAVASPRRPTHAERSASAIHERRRAERLRLRRVKRVRRMAGLAVVAAVVVGVVLRNVSDSEKPSPLPAEQPVAAYRTVTEITELDSPVRTETRTVRRPFESRLESVRDGVMLLGSVSTRDGFWQYSAGDNPGWRKVRDGSQRADDPRPLPALRESLRRGLATFLGESTVAGRPCWKVRTGAPLGAEMKRASAKEHADFCVDRSGLLLSERWEADGKLVRTQVVREVDTTPVIDASTFRTEPELPAPGKDVPGVAVVSALPSGDRASLPGRVRPPSGYRYVGGTRRVIAGGSGDPIYVEHFVRGFELLEVEQGTRAPGLAPKGIAVPIGRLGVGYLQLDLGASSIVVPVGESDYVRLRGPDVNLLRSTARELRPA